MKKFLRNYFQILVIILAVIAFMVFSSIPIFMAIEYSIWWLLLGVLLVWPLIFAILTIGEDNND